MHFLKAYGFFLMDNNIIGTQWAFPQIEHLSPGPFAQSLMLLLPFPATRLLPFAHRMLKNTAQTESAGRKETRACRGRGSHSLRASASSVGGLGGQPGGRRQEWALPRAGNPADFSGVQVPGDNGNVIWRKQPFLGR